MADRGKHPCTAVHPKWLIRLMVFPGVICPESMTLFVYDVHCGFAVCSAIYLLKPDDYQSRHLSLSRGKAFDVGFRLPRWAYA